MSTNPVDHTTVIASEFTSSTFFSRTEKHAYKDFSQPEFMPGAALCIETINEWAAWWHWHIDKVADAARQAERKVERKARAVWPWGAIKGDPA